MSILSKGRMVVSMVMGLVMSSSVAYTDAALP